MDPLDDLFEKSLQSIEDGVSLDDVIHSLPGEAVELEPLIRMAVQARTMKHPELDLLTASKQKLLVERYMMQKDSTPARMNGNHRAATEKRWLWVLAPASAVFLMVCVVAIVALSLYLAGPVRAETAVVRNTTGIVELASTVDPTGWQVVSDGTKLQQGAHLRTRVDSSVTLVFYDGSRTTLGPSSDVVISHLSGGWFGSLQVALAQKSGATEHSVMALKGTSSYFNVRAPGGTAVVHGTVFSVDVNSSGDSRFAVDRGKVEVSAQSSDLFLSPGQATVVVANSGPTNPEYAFFTQGQISAISGDRWTVSGVTFQTAPTATDNIHYQVGDWVAVSGRLIQSDGSQVGDIVEPITLALVNSHFSGLVETIGTDSWTIGGKTVLINSKTEIDQDIKVGDPVEVAFVVLPNGQWLAKSIEALDQDEENDGLTTTPTVEETGTTTPETTETEVDTETKTPEVTEQTTPTGVLTPTVEVTPTLTPTEVGHRAGCDQEDKQHPEGLTLAARFQVPYAEIMGWFCQGFGFGEIDLAYELSATFGKPVADIFALRSSGLGWGEVKHMLASGSTLEPRPTKHGKGNGSDVQGTEAPETEATKAPKPGHGNDGEGGGPGH